MRARGCQGGKRKWVWRAGWCNTPRCKSMGSGLKARYGLTPRSSLPLALIQSGLVPAKRDEQAVGRADLRPRPRGRERC